MLVSFRMATAEDKHLPTYDNTKLVAYNTCPTWGILRYQMHKRMPGSGRAMALEMGSAAHELFAWVRLCTLAEQLPKNSIETLAAFQHHGIRLFGEDRFNLIISQCEPTIDKVAYCKQGGIAVLETSGFYDDERDRRRTLTNLEESCLHYIDRWRWPDVWIRDPANPCGDVGIEIPFDIVCSIDYAAGTDMMQPRIFRITGKIDGIHLNEKGAVILHENKTASRLNDAWVLSFAMASQITHYCIASSVFTETDIRKADVLGLCVPLPKTYDFGGYHREPVSRQDHHIKRWVDWLIYTVRGYMEYENNPYDAPQFTHSCNRYFRPCSFIPFCEVDSEEQRIVVSQMEDDEWSPLTEVVEE